MIEICKTIHVCNKKDYRSIVVLLNSCTKLLVKACADPLNRSYIILTNSVLSLVDLLQ